MKTNQNIYIGKWESLYRIVLNTYFDGVTLTHTMDGEEHVYKAEKNHVILYAPSVADLERKMFQAGMDLETE